WRDELRAAGRFLPADSGEGATMNEREQAIYAELTRCGFSVEAIDAGNMPPVEPNKARRKCPGGRIQFYYAAQLVQYAYWLEGDRWYELAPLRRCISTMATIPGAATLGPIAAREPNNSTTTTRIS